MGRAAAPPPLRVGVDVGGTKLLLAARVADGVHVQRAATGAATRPDGLECAIRDFLAGLGAPVAALGVAVPGLVGGRGEVVACDVLPRLVGWEPAAAFADLGCAVCVLNDAEAALREETHDLPPGATAGVVLAGTAVGAAFLVDGQPLRGARGWAGELGYLPLPTADGVKRLDELAGGAWLAARLGTDGAGLAARVGRGDAAALEAVAAGGAALGLGLAAVVNLLNPELLAVGGGTSTLPGYFESAVRSAEAHSLPELWRVCTLRRARGGAALVALGAARAAAADSRSA